MGQFNGSFDWRNYVPLLALVVVEHDAVTGVDGGDLVRNGVDYFNENVDIRILDSDNGKFQKNKSDDLITNLAYIKRLVYKVIGVPTLFALHQIITNFN